MESTYELPEGWEWSTIGEACTVNVRDPRLRKLPDHLQVSFVPMAAVSAERGAISDAIDRNLGDVRKGFTPFANGDVIFARITPSMENGKAAIAAGLTNDLGFGSTEFHVMRPSESVLAEWVFHFVRQVAFRNKAKASFTGTAGQLRVPDSFVRSASIPLPPLPEQRRIVDKMERLLEQSRTARQALDRIPPLLKRFRQSILAKAFRGELTERDPRDEAASILLERIRQERRRKWEEDLRARGKDPRKAKYVEAEPPDTSGLPGLPEGWVWGTIEQMADQRLGKMLDKVKNKGIERQYLRNVNVKWFGFDLGNLHTMRVEAEELENISVRYGDLVVCEGGEPGRAAVWERREEDMVVQKALHRVRFRQGIPPRYVAYRLASDALNGRLEAYFTGSTIKHFTGIALRSYALPLAPIGEMCRIVLRLQSLLEFCDKIGNAIELTRRRAEHVDQAVLARAFRGEL